ncbi:ABC transporter ATP-binding protein, partial [Streptomyces sp. NPDC050211]|uniref:ABC transporter ATP-binding protein n=1 Tax=Streptomyces sp. NPDC050211 TaxID=3154932 RepID=UPI003415041B
DTGAAARRLGALAAAALAAAAMNYVHSMMGYRLGIALIRGLRHRVGDHIAGLPLGWFTGERVGRLGRTAGQGLMDVAGAPAHLLGIVVTGVVTPATVAVLMFVFDWRLGLALIVAAPLLAVMYRVTGALVQRTDHAVDAAAAEAGGRVVEFARSQAVLRAHGRTAAGHELLDRALRDQHRAGYRQIRTALPGIAGFSLSVQLAFTLVFVIAAVLVTEGSAAPAELIAVLVLAARFAEPLIEAVDVGSALRITRNSLARTDEVLATEPLPEPAAAAHAGEPSIELDGVRFSYGDRTVLDGVSFTVPPRTLTALVGSSGSGKTTITRLIARFWDVDAGTVRVGGADVRDLATEDLMRQISLVFQDVYLFEGTIEDNIRLGRPDATDEQIRIAARQARVGEIVERLPDGWHTQVGEGGTRLSGGERQRVSIARALLKDAPIVLLDEATAALDPENEAAVQDALAALTADRTVLVIAHRLQTVTGADQIVVLDSGRIVETGSHDELLVRGGRYAAFWTERSRAQGWRLEKPTAV